MNMKVKTNSARVIVQTPNQYKKICKFFFTQRDSSLYIHFYFKGNKYFYGLKKFSAGIKETTFKFTKGKFAPKAPKLSYHESGEVHFKLSDRESKVFIKTTPIKDLDGDHIITIIANTLNGFEDLNKRDKNPYALVKFPRNIESLKLTIWGSAREVPKACPVWFNLKRPTLPNVFFGIKAVPQSSISKDEAGLTVITGWDIDAADISRSAEFLYLQGK